MDERNFSIILPGACNAKCEFCFWSRSQAESPMYVQQLRWYLERMNLTQVSITGGEPTISPLLEEVLEALADFDLKVVLTSNGCKLFDKLIFLQGIVDHINVSRHASEDNMNNFIFGTEMPTTEELRNICGLANRYGIDVTLNRVVREDWDSEIEFGEYLELASNVGASAVAFRKDYSGNSLEPVPLETSLEHAGRTSSCPVCITTTYLIRGLRVHFKRSLEETDLQGVHEYVYHPDGRLTSDWAGMNPLVGFGKYVEYTGADINRQIIRIAPNGSCRQVSGGCGSSGCS